MASTAAIPPTTKKRSFLGLQLKNGYETKEVFYNSHELQMLRDNYSPEFAELHTLAMAKYVAGDWAMARTVFEECLTWKPKDGPT
jgi:hypothetical protein